MYKSISQAFIAAAFALASVTTVRAAEEKKDQKNEKAEWVQRCDRLKEEKRVECLDRLRAEAQQRFLDAEAEAKTPADKAAQPAETNKKPPASR